MTATVSAGGSIEIPEAFRMEDSIREGQVCDIERVGKGEYRIVVSRVAAGDDSASWLDVLLDCPVKDWFQPVPRVETTDDLEPLRFE
ncbi:MAG: hypothetical protein KDK99_18035 [Verrucomicrobiales bacterium]|nr:hypothetical protein [Verrucomicrobiales bacterium]